MRSHLVWSRQPIQKLDTSPSLLLARQLSLFRVCERHHSTAWQGRGIGKQCTSPSIENHRTLSHISTFISSWASFDRTFLPPFVLTTYTLTKNSSSFGQSYFPSYLSLSCSPGGLVHAHAAHGTYLRVLWLPSRRSMECGSSKRYSLM